jgi:hypothetical protein
MKIEHMDWHDGRGFSTMMEPATRADWEKEVETFPGVLDMSFRLVDDDGKVLEQWDSPRNLIER